MWPITKSKNLTEIRPKITQLLELTDKNFKVPIITTLMDMKEDMLLINGKKGNLAKEIKDTKKINRILKWKL